MLTEDYFMRMINQAIYVLKKIMGLKTTGHNKEALAEIEQLIELLVGMKASTLKLVDDQNIIDALSAQGEVDPDRLYVVAELYREEGEVLEALDRREEALLSSLRALNFYLEVSLRGGGELFPPPDEHIAALQEKLGGFELPAATLYPLFCYFEEQGRYIKAEQTLERLADDPEIEAETRREQTAFYQRLLEKPDEALEKANLSRQQVQAKLEAITKGD
jgi:tetratricopeptide (TPR) repeat protein